ncbi:MAG: hypothetical protein ICV66_11570 [Chitinophagaceae bacterium]|nr:hypothetical protein [Chitinophagaceae bacterium]
MQPEEIKFIHPDFWESDEAKERRKELKDSLAYSPEGFVFLHNNKRYSVFNVWLYLFFSCEEIPTVHKEMRSGFYSGGEILKSTENFNGMDYFDSYVSGFDEGVKYFIKHYRVNNDTLHKESYIKNLRLCYDKEDPITYKQGWAHWIRSYPIGITKEK